MEIKATLQKPYTEEQRLDFIVKCNHQNGFDIKETETALEAWGLTEAEKEARVKEYNRNKIIAELDALDLKCIRSLRALQSGSGTEEDTSKLAEYEAQVAELRQKLKDIENTEVSN